MSYKKEEVRCPKCNKKLKVKVYAKLDESQITDIINRDIFMVKCDKCGNKTYVDYQVDLETPNYYLYYTPGYNKSKSNIKGKLTRVCDTYDDFKEKILILEEGLNDILIEFIKMYIKNELKEDDLAELRFVRFDSVIDDNIIFTLVGLKKNVAIKKDFYDSLLEKSTFKRPLRAIVLDRENFWKYHRMK